MKMASAAFVFLLLLCCTVIPTASKSECTMYAATGRDFVVLLPSKMQDPPRLTWYYKQEKIFSRKGAVVSLGKSDDVDQNGSLKLKNVTSTQSGLYKKEVHNKEGKLVSDAEATLCVIAPVPKPKVNTTCEGSQVIFTCIIQNVQQKKDTITVTWSQNDKVVKNANNWVVKYEAKSVKWDFFTCNISNRASNAVSDGVQQICITSIFPDEVYGISIWVFVGGGGGIVLVLIIVVVFCCFRTRRIKQMRLKDEDELRLQWTNPNHPPHHSHSHHSHQHHHSHHHPSDHQHHHQQSHRQQPAGNTGPRPSRTRQHRDQKHRDQKHRDQQHRDQQHRDQQHCDQQRRLPEPPGSGQPLPSPRRAAQEPRSADNADTEQPPPLPQPRKKAPRAQRV